MTVCGKRTDDPGFFTSCVKACGADGCRCGADVRADIKAEIDAAGAEPEGDS